MKTSAFLTNIDHRSDFTHTLERATVAIDKLMAASAEKIDERGNMLIAARYRLPDGRELMLVAGNAGYDLYRPLTAAETIAVMAPPRS
jgi:hypothetical protein